MEAFLDSADAIYFLDEVDDLVLFRCLLRMSYAGVPADRGREEVAVAV
jgi:hypothetical protein